MSFYRTYRPQVIEDIDNVHVREQLTSLLSKDRKDLPHAYLFTGSRGAGKTTAARIVAKIFNCTKPGKHGPCGTCEQCVSIAGGKNLDVLELDAASNRGIDEMRQIRDSIGLAPSAALYKVYIIDEVHMLTTEAFNALLKTLEEPPAHAIFILATTDPQKVPATIKSRCITIAFHKATVDEVTNGLKRIAKVESIKINPDAMAMIAQETDGSFRDAVKTLELLSFSKKEITIDMVRSLMSVADEAVLIHFLEHVRARDPKKALGVIAQLVSDGKDIKIFLTNCLEKLHDDLIHQTASDTSDLIRRFTEAYGLMKVSPIGELPLELAVIEFCQERQNQRPPVPEPTAPVHPHVPAATKPPPQPTPVTPAEPPIQSLGLLTFEKLTEHWPDFIASVKPYNNSIAGVLRSARPKAVDHGIVTIEAFYPFHKDKLSEPKTKDILVDILKKLFGEKVKVEIVVGKK